MLVYLELLVCSLLIAVVANVVVHTLMEEDMVLSWYKNLLDKYSFDREGGYTWFYYLSKPLGGCDVCFGGQLALLFYFFCNDYNFVIHIFFICLTIKLIEWLRKRN